MKEFVVKMKDLKISDFFAGLKLLIAIIPCLIYKIYLKRKGLRFWLICEESMEAQDNGWCFFRFINEKHPEVKTIYAIEKIAPMYDQVRSIGKVVNYGSIMHWIYYLCAEVNISSQKGGKPNAAICYVLEVYGFLKNRRVFLQHGIIMNDCEYLYYQNTKMWMFVTSSKLEYEFIREKFGYPEDTLVCTGLSRFDYLKNEIKDKVILLMPSWRYWLKLPSKVSEEMNGEFYDFESSEYFEKYQSLITDERFINLLNKYGFRVIFYPHRNIQEHISSFKSISDKIEIASCSEYDIQELLNISSIMITDYSSVSFDFAYLDKPILYYQFDEERFRKYQYAEGYFSYKNDGFGSVCHQKNDLLKELELIMCNEVEEKYALRRASFFAYHDKNNSERIYNAISGQLKEENVK